MRITLVALAAAVLVSPLPARADFPRLGIFRKKKEDPPPPPKAKQSAEALLSSPDEKKRLAAVGELKDQDPRSNPDVIPALITALQRDPSPAVRAAAAETIGKLKPVAQPAGVALEQSVATDPADEVRKAAQKGLWDYHLNGYKAAGAVPAYPQTAEPPLAKPRVQGVTIPPPQATVATPSPAAQPVTPRPITSGIGKGAIYPQTIEPPLAKPKPSAVAPPSPTLSVPPLPPPGAGVSIPPPPATTATAPPPAAASVPSIPIPMPPGPSAPTVPAGPTVPTIPPPSSGQ